MEREGRCCQAKPSSLIQHGRLARGFDRRRLRLPDGQRTSTGRHTTAAEPRTSDSQAVSTRIRPAGRRVRASRQRQASRVPAFRQLTSLGLTQLEFSASLAVVTRNLLVLSTYYITLCLHLSLALGVESGHPPDRLTTIAQPDRLTPQQSATPSPSACPGPPRLICPGPWCLAPLAPDSAIPTVPRPLLPIPIASAHLVVRRLISGEPISL